MNYILQSILSINIRHFKYMVIVVTFVLFKNTAWAQHQCTGECYVEPDYTTTVTTKLPFAKNETEVTVGIKDGIAYYQGDIILGKLSKLLEKGIVRSDASYRWPNSTIPYILHDNFYNYPFQLNKVNDAIAHIMNNTNLCIVPRTTEVNYLKFEYSLDCESSVGMQGGHQQIFVGPFCSLGATIHEILHAAGLYHEHTRSDRDDYVDIHWENIEPGKEDNFVKPGSDGMDIGPYDYGSIMHYGEYDFSIDIGVLPTITTIPPGIPIGQRIEMSAGDIAAVNFMYPTPCCLDDQAITSTFDNGDDDYFEVNNWITSTATVNTGANVTHDAGNYICLNSGFLADSGSEFLAKIDGCDSNPEGLVEGGSTSNQSQEDELGKVENTGNEKITVKNYPNPFTGQTTIEFTLQEDSSVKLSVSDVTGKQIAVLLNNEQQAGTHQVIFDGSAYPAGMYYYTIQAGQYMGTQKMTLIK